LPYGFNKQRQIHTGCVLAWGSFSVFLDK
jgi:hypothetical protein